MGTGSQHPLWRARSSGAVGGQTSYTAVEWRCPLLYPTQWPHLRQDEVLHGLHLALRIQGAIELLHPARVTDGIQRRYKAASLGMHLIQQKIKV